MESGLLTLEEFKECVQHFVETSSRLGDGWHTVPAGDSLYMRKKCTCTVEKVLPLDQDKKEHAGKTQMELDTEEPNSLCQPSQQESQPPSADDDFTVVDEDGDLKEDDENCATVCPASLPSQVLTYDYHVVYSDSYSVPVLYLNITTMNGKRLTLDEVWAMCPDSFQPYLNDNKWTTLTQQEHPLLGRPFLMLHPCNTAELLKQVFKGNETMEKVNYLSTWLSTVGPLVGLKISMEYSGK